MKKMISGIVAAGVLFSGIGAQTANASSNLTENLHYPTKATSVKTLATNKNNIDLRIDGGYGFNTDIAPILKNNRILVAFRPIAEYMDATLQWDAKNKKVTIIRKGKKVEITNGQKVGYVNGVKKNLDESVQIIDGRVYVPLRFVSESLGAQVSWNKLSGIQVVDITVYKTNSIVNYYANTNGELGSEITEYQSALRIEQGIAVGREIVRSFSSIDVTDGTSKMYTAHIGKYDFNGKIEEVLSITEYDVNPTGTAFTNGRYNVYTYNVDENTLNEELLFEKSGKAKDFSTAKEVLEYSGYDLLQDLGYQGQDTNDYICPDGTTTDDLSNC